MSILVGGLSLGCATQEAATVVVENLPDPSVLLKQSFEEIVKNGKPTGDSGLKLQGYAAELHKKDPDKSRALLEGIDELSQISDPEQAKAKAKELLRLLESN